MLAPVAGCVNKVAQAGAGLTRSTRARGAAPPRPAASPPSADRHASLRASWPAPGPSLGTNQRLRPPHVDAEAAEEHVLEVRGPADEEHGGTDHHQRDGHVLDAPPPRLELAVIDGQSYCSSSGHWNGITPNGTSTRRRSQDTGADEPPETDPVRPLARRDWRKGTLVELRLGDDPARGANRLLRSHRSWDDRLFAARGADG